MDQIPLFKVRMPETSIERANRVLRSGYIGQGPEVEAFERALQTYIGGGNVVTVNSGTSAIQLALRLAGVKSGDEVISTPMTCTATNMPIMAAGAKIVWADINPETGNISPTSVKGAITDRTKAIICVDWGGYPCDLEDLKILAHSHNIKLIEDAAHSFGANYQGRKVGMDADFVCFSFQAIKHLTTIDGGAVICKNPEDADRGKILRWFGIDRNGPRKDFRCEIDVTEWGYKFHMNDVCAAIGIEGLKDVDKVITEASSHAAKYDEVLCKIPGEKLSKLSYSADRNSSYWLYTLKAENRESFVEYLKSKGIVASQVHSRNDLHTVFRPFRKHLPGVNQFAACQVSIPVGWWIGQDGCERIAEAMTQYCEI